MAIGHLQRFHEGSRVVVIAGGRANLEDVFHRSVNKFTERWSQEIVMSIDTEG